MIARMPFGSTGHESSRALFGAVALAPLSQAEADSTLDFILDFGVNHIDVAASYGDSELRLAPWLKHHRQDVFLASKTGMRDFEGAWLDIHRSLERMGVGYLDLIQLHNLVSQDDWTAAMASGGAMEALIKAKDEGLVRFIGVTGHGFGAPRRHLESLARYPFDSVLVPYSWTMCQNAAYAADMEALLATCAERDVAVVTIKAVARRPLPAARRWFSWYEPLEDPAQISLAMSWVLGNPQVFLATTGNAELLRPVLDAAANPGPRPSDAEMRALAEAMEMAVIYDGDATISMS